MNSPVLLGPALILLYAVIRHLHPRRLTQRRIIQENNCKPPTRLPSKDPLFGLDKLWEVLASARDHRFLALYEARFRNHGTTILTKRFLTPMILTTEPENIKAALSLRFKDYGHGERLASFGPMLGHGIFTADGEHWAQSRAMIRPNMAKDQVADLVMFEELMRDMFELIPSDGGTVDMMELFFMYTIDSATEFLFGHSVQTLKKKIKGSSGPGGESEYDFAEAFNYAQGAIRTKLRLGPLKILHRDRKADECIQTCHQVVQQFVEKALDVGKSKDTGTTKKKRYLFLDALAKQTHDRQRIQDELMNMLLAGRDTTASLLSNLFFMLAKHPTIWNKLREEIAALDGRPPTYDELRNLTYLKYCINESLRLHPVVPINARFAEKDTILPVGGGPEGQSPVFVPQGAMVIYTVYSMHRREDFYGPDAFEFRPERWADLRPGWKYLPFNGGPRICVGQQYAITEAAYVTARLVQRFSTLESRDGGPWEENLTMTLSPRNGTMVSLWN